jgi:peptidoglycan/LPS O-acetylase OafA/YrhL
MSDKKFNSLEFMRKVGAPVGLLLILAGLVAPFFFAGTFYAHVIYKYVYALGAALCVVAAFCMPRNLKDLRLRRLYRLELCSAVLFVVAAGIAFTGAYGSGRDWIALTLAGAAIKIYTTIAIPNRQQKLK